MPDNCEFIFGTVVYLNFIQPTVLHCFCSYPYPLDDSCSSNCLAADSTTLCCPFGGSCGFVTTWIHEYKMSFTFWWSVLHYVLRMIIFEAAKTL